MRIVLEEVVQQTHETRAEASVFIRVRGKTVSNHTKASLCDLSSWEHALMAEHCFITVLHRSMHRKWQYVFQMSVRDSQSLLFISCHLHNTSYISSWISKLINMKRSRDESAFAKKTNETKWESQRCLSEHICFGHFQTSLFKLNKWRLSRSWTYSITHHMIAFKRDCYWWCH